MFKKLISFILVIGMILSLGLYSGGVSAEEGEGTILYEFEVDGTKSGYGNIVTAPDGTGYYYYLGTGDGSATTITGTVEIPESGYYKVTSLIGYNESTAHSVVTLNIGDYSIVNTSKKYTKKYDDSYSCSSSVKHRMSEYEQTLWFDKGEVVVKLCVAVAETVAKRISYQADYVKFEKLTNPIFDFANYASSVTGYKRSDGNLYMYYANSVGAVTESKFINIPIKITETGDYKVTYFISYSTSYSDINLSLKSTDGVEVAPIGNNEQVGTTPEATYSTSYGTVYQYETLLEDISAGEYIIEAEVVNTANGRWVCSMDSIEFALQATENENSLTTENGTVTANVYYDKAISGTPIIALYKGQELVIAGKGDVLDSADSVTISVNTTEAFDKAKVFVWDDTVSMIPQIASEILYNE